MAFSLKPETLERIDAAILRYGAQRRSALMPVLHLVQAEQGCIPREAVEWVAEKLGMQPINVLEVVTFFPSYRQEDRKLGRTHVRLCRTLSCALMGAYKVGEELEKELGCRLGTTREDGSITLEYAECLAACGTGPVALVDEDLFENVTAEKLGPIIEEIKKRAAGGAPTPTNA
jgi:NADH-quinone oxidoreductase subunit E